MAILLAGTGALFPRWGREIAGANEACLAVGSTANTRTTLINNQYLAAQQQLASGLYSSRDSYRASDAQYLSDLQALMQSTLIQMAKDDGTGIVPPDLTTALTKLISQMATSNDTINRPTVSATVTAGGSNVGNGFCRVSLIDPSDGKQTDYLIAETITATCTADGYLNGGATSGQEPFTFTGQASAAVQDWNWPQGSGASISINAVDASVRDLILTDGDFEEWGGTGNNTPDNWSTGATATFGTTVIRSAVAPYTGTYNLRIVGDGSQLTTLRQELSLDNLAPDAVYFFNGLAKTTDTAGVLRIRLVDGNNAVINDNLGTANSVSTNLSDLTTSYTAITTAFRTPSIMPDTVKIEIGLTTAMTNATTLDIDHFAVAAANLFYGTTGGGGGPYFALFSGDTEFAIGDTFSIATTNSLTTSSFAVSLNRWLGLTALGQKIPSSTNPTIGDNEIN